MRVKIILAIIVCLSLNSCSRHIRESLQKKVQDSLSSFVTSSSNKKTLFVKTIIKKDSAIKTPQKTISDVIPDSEVKAKVTKNGVAQRKHYQKTDNGLTAYVDLYPDGHIQYGAVSDSLTTIIQNLTYICDSIINDNDSMKNVLIDKTHTATIDQSKTDEKDFWGDFKSCIIWLVVLLVVIAVIYWLYKKYG